MVDGVHLLGGRGWGMPSALRADELGAECKQRPSQGDQGPKSPLRTQPPFANAREDSPSPPVGCGVIAGGS